MVSVPQLLVVNAADAIARGAAQTQAFQRRQTENRILQQQERVIPERERLRQQQVALQQAKTIAELERIDAQAAEKARREAAKTFVNLIDGVVNGPPETKQQRYQIARQRALEINPNLNLPEQLDDQTEARVIQLRNELAAVAGEGALKPVSGSVPDAAPISLMTPDGQVVQVRRDDPRVDQLLRSGAVQVKVVTNPVSGEPQLVNTATGEVIGQQENQQPEQPAEQPLGIPPEKILDAAFGPVAAIRSAAENVPVVSELVPGEENRKAITAIVSLEKDIERAFANNPRFPVAELQRLKALIPRPGIISTASAARAQLEQLRDEIVQRISIEDQIASDPRQGRRQRADALSTAARAEALLQKLDAILGGQRNVQQGEFPQPSQASIDLLKANPSLAPFFDRKFGPGAAQRVLQNAQ